LFIISIYAALSFLHPHHVHVQGAPAMATWFALRDDFADFALLTSMVVINKNFASTTMASSGFSVSPLRPSRRLWDPGGTSSASVWAIALLILLATVAIPVYGHELYVLTWLSPVSPIDCSTTPLSSLHASIGSMSPIAPLTGSMDRASVKRSFQYCHPVLSRPTVPNII